MIEFTESWISGESPDAGAPMRDRAVRALATNAAYLTLSTPTAAQTGAQLRALTRQVQALLRLTIGQFDSTDGT